MAARENQGYLIAVICLTLLSLVLALSTFLAASKASQYYDGQTLAESKLAIEKKVSDANLIEADIMRSLVGGDDLGKPIAELGTMRDSLETLWNSASDDGKTRITDARTRVSGVLALYDADMNMNISSSDGEEDEAAGETWSRLAKNLSRLLATKHGELNTRQNELLETQKEAAAKIEQVNNKLKATETSLSAKIDELEKEKGRNLAKEKSLQASLDEIESKNTTDNKEFQKQRTQFVDNISKLKNENNLVKSDNDVLSDRIATLTAEDFDLPDGKIVRVAGGVVYLNIGSDDGLRRNQTFSVYDSKINQFEKNQHKASIEVTAVTGPHQARARVTSEIIINPILEDDHIVTPTWDPGWQVPIALVGMFDLDGDQSSDRQLLIRQIENNGGKVVAYHDDDGNITGKIDASTRYVVLGEAPAPGLYSSSTIYDSITTLKDQGKKYRIQEMNTRKLLNWMGRHGRPIVEHLDQRVGNFQKRAAPNYLVPTAGEGGSGTKDLGGSGTKGGGSGTK